MFPVRMRKVTGPDEVDGETNFVQRRRQGEERREGSTPLRHHIRSSRSFLVAYASVPGRSLQRPTSMRNIAITCWRKGRSRVQTSDIKRHYAPRYLSFLKNVRRGSRYERYREMFKWLYRYFQTRTTNVDLWFVPENKCSIRVNLYLYISTYIKY